MLEGIVQHAAESFDREKACAPGGAGPFGSTPPGGECDERPEAPPIGVPVYGQNAELYLSESRDFATVFRFPVSAAMITATCAPHSPTLVWALLSGTARQFSPASGLSHVARKASLRLATQTTKLDSNWGRPHKMSSSWPSEGSGLRKTV